MRRVVLPTCRTIGAELDRIRALYPRGKKGPGGQPSRFFRDAEQFTGLKKAHVLNYISIAKGWGRLVEHLAELPEGAEPIRSMGAALEVLRAMNRPDRPALPSSNGAVDVDAEAVQGSDSPRTRTHYAHGTREKVLPPLVALKATPVGLKHQARLDQILDALHDLLDAMEAEEQGEELGDTSAAAEGTKPSRPLIGAPAPAPSAPPAPSHPATAPTPVAVLAEPPGEEAAAAAAGDSRPGYGTLPALYPATVEGLEALEAAIVQHGSGIALGRSLGLSPAAVRAHRRRIREKLRVLQ
jgi:hypothetical protein